MTPCIAQPETTPEDTERRGSFRAGQAIWIQAMSCMALLGLLALTACTRDAGDTQKDPLITSDYYSSSLTVCRLLTRQDLEMALGRRFQKPRDPVLSGNNAFVGVSGKTLCAWDTPGFKEQGFMIAVVRAFGRQIFADTENVIRGKKGSANQNQYRGPIHVVPNLGDRAIWLENGELRILTGDKIVLVFLPAAFLEPQEIAMERARRLGVKILERMR